MKRVSRPFDSNPKVVAGGIVTWEGRLLMFELLLRFETYSHVAGFEILNGDGVRETSL